MNRAGYDLLIVLSNAGVRRFVAGQQGVIRTVLAGRGLHATIADFDVELSSTAGTLAGLTITVLLANGSVSGTSAVGLSGTLRIQNLSMAFQSPNQVSDITHLAVDLSHATAGFDPALQTQMTAQGIAAARVGQIESQIGSVLQSFGALTATTLHLAPAGVPGSLSGSLRVIGPTAKGLADPSAPSDRTKQGLAIFANLLPGTPAGSLAAPMPCSLDPSNTFGVSISPAAFHTLLLAPVVTRAIQSTAPPPAGSMCGSNMSSMPGSLSDDGTMLTLSLPNAHGVATVTIRDFFVTGQVTLGCTFDQALLGFDLNAQFGGGLTMLANGTASVTPSLTWDRPIVVAANPTGAYASLVAGPLGWAAAGQAGQSYSDTASQSLGCQLDQIDSTLMPVPLPTIGSLSLSITGTAIDTTGLDLLGNLVTMTASPPASVQVWCEARTDSPLLVSSSPSSSPTSSGSYESRICPIGTFPFQEYLQLQAMQVDFSVWPPGTPLQVTLISGASSQALLLAPHSFRTVTLYGVRCSYALPLPVGQVLDQPVEITYFVTGSDGEWSLLLFNRPGDGNYPVTVSVTADGAPSLASVSFQFRGDVLELGGNYPQLAAQCWRGYLQEQLGAPLSGHASVRQFLLGAPASIDPAAIRNAIASTQDPSRIQRMCSVALLYPPSIPDE